MEKIIVTLGSVTTASRFKKLLSERYRANAEIIHTPVSLNCGSCSYSLRCKMNELDAVKRLAEEIGFKIKGVYREELNIRGERQYNALS